MPRLRALIDAVEIHLGRVEEIVAILALIAIAALVNLQVVARYIFDTPFIWPEEVTRLLLVWLSFLGAAAVARRGADMAVTTFVLMLAPRGRLAAAALRDVVLVALFAFIMFQGLNLVRALTGMELVATEWSSTLLAWPLVISAFLMALHPALRLTRAVLAVGGVAKVGEGRR